MQIQEQQRRVTGLFERIFEGHTIRVQQDDRGEPWFCAKDVCEAVGLAKPENVYPRLDADEKVTLSVGTPGGAQEMTFISEPGLYALVGRSRKPEAKRFDRWVRHEVLPSIRRTGGYGVASETNAALAQIAALNSQLIGVMDAVAKQGAQLTALFARMPVAGSISAADVDVLKRDIEEVVATLVACGKYGDKKTPARQRRAARAYVYAALRELFGWGGSGQNWATMPADRLAPVLAHLRAMRRDALEHLNASRALGQLTLVHPANTNAGKSSKG